MAALPEQNDRPKTVLIFGAGASYSAGIPLQADLIPQILKSGDLQLRKSEAAKRIRNFLASNFPNTKQYPSLEEVFGFLEFFISNEYSLSKNEMPSDLRNLRTDLIKVIHYLISRGTERSVDFTAFWNVIANRSAKVGVITTNYDTAIDEAFDDIFPDCLIDYCLDFVNYRSPEAGDPFNWWIDPKKPTDINGDNRVTRIKILKLHGSLNWKYCTTCGQVVLTPWQHGLDLKLDTFESFFDSKIQFCKFDQTRLQSLLQPPSHFKTTTNHVFNRLYDEAAFMIGNANHLIFVGYSFPEADVHIRALVKRCFSKDGTITVINKSRAKDLRHRYEGLARNVNYHEYTFERFLKSGLFESLLSANQSLHSDAAASGSAG